MPGEEFAPYAGEVARMLWGEPNRSLSSAVELRFGNKGSRSVDLTKGVWKDYSDDVGGGVLDLIARETGCDRRGAVDWLRENGFHVEDRSSFGTSPAPKPNGHGKGSNPPPADRGNSSEGPPFRVVKTWDYTDEAGTLLFQVCRMENGETLPTGKPRKTYRQRRPDPKGRDGWSWSVKGVRLVPYRLQDILEEMAMERLIFITEGEKAADRLWDLGVPATTNPMGAGKWPAEINAFFRDAHVCILPDNDEPGRKHLDTVAKGLLEVTKDVRAVELPGLPEQGDVVEWLEAGGTVDRLYELAQAARRIEAKPFVSRFNAVTWADLDAPGAEHEWLIKGVLTRYERSMVAGPSQSGKSFLVLDMALAIARGIPWQGRRTIHGGVVYQAGEGGKGLKKRLRAYRSFHGITTQDPIPFVLLPKPIDLYGTDDQTAAFIEEAKHWSTTFDVPLELIVIDTFSAATPGANENASEDVGPVLARCERIAEACRCAVMLVHHMNSEGSKPRGHTSIFANLDNVITVTKVEGHHDEGPNGQRRQIREAKVTKQKDGEDGATFRFVLPSVAIGTDADGEPVTSCVVAVPNATGSGEAGEREGGVKLTTQAEIFLQAVYKAVSEQGERPPFDLKLPASITKVVDWRVVRDEFAKLSSDGDDEKDEAKKAAAVRQALKRHGDTLVARGIIGRSNPWVWLTGKRVKGFRSPIEAPQRTASFLPPPDDRGQDWDEPLEVAF